MRFKNINLKLWINKYLWKIILFVGSIYASTLLGPIFSSLNKYLFEILKGPSLGLYHALVYFINAEIPIYSLFIALTFVWIVSEVYRFIEIKNRKLKIIKALYGKDSKYVDITDKLNDIIEDNKLKVVLSNAIAGDPIVRVIKEGKIKYKYNGEKKEKIYTEGDVIELP